jgi:hypothetical protein
MVLQYMFLSLYDEVTNVLRVSLLSHDRYRQVSTTLTVLITLKESIYFRVTLYNNSRSQWPRFLRRGSAAARLLGLWVRIPPGAWMFFCCECCVLSGRGLCVGLITRPEESYRLWCI